MLADEEKTKKLISDFKLRERSLKQLVLELREKHFDVMVSNAFLYYIGTKKIPNVTFVRENWRIICMAGDYATALVFFN